MILANHFEDTKKSILNISARIIDIIHNHKNNKFEQILSQVEKELDVSYDKVIVSINFLYMIGNLEYDVETDTLRFVE